MISASKPATGSPAQSANAAPFRLGLKELDSCRIACVILIILYHGKGIIGFEAPAYFDLFGALVGYFFVLSGFILAYRYEALESWPQVGRFLGSRLARIMPSHLATLALVLLINFNPFYDRSQALPVVLSHIFCVQAWTAEPNFLKTLNAPTWTISVDAFLYLIFPVLLFCSRRKWLLLTACLVVQVYLAMQYFLWPNIDPVWCLWYQPLSHVLDMALGIALYKVVAARKFALGLISTLLIEASLIGTALFMANWSSSHSQTNMPISLFCMIFFVLIRPFFLLLVFVVSSGKGVTNLVFSNPWLYRSSSLAAALYFVHFPLLTHFSAYIGTDPVLRKDLILQSEIYGLIGFSAFLLYALIEVPLRVGLNQYFDSVFPEHALMKGENGRKDWGNMGVLPSRKRMAQVFLVGILTFVSYCLIRNRIDSSGFIPEAASPLGISTVCAAAPSQLRNISFGGLVSLSAVNLSFRDGAWHFCGLWEALPAARKCTLAVHLVDAKGAIVRQYDHLLLGGKPPHDLVWLDDTKIPAQDLTGVEAIALAVTVKGKAVPCVSKFVDWGGYRLVIPMPILKEQKRRNLLQ